MAKKRKKVFVPTDLDGDVSRLREVLAKLKDKEARLEADLAIKETPALEQGIILLVLAVADVERATEFLRVASVGKSAVARRADTLMMQLDGYGRKLSALKDDDSESAAVQRRFYESRAASVRAMLDESGEEVSEFTVLRGNVEAATAKVREVYDAWRLPLQMAGIDLQVILPKVCQYVDGSG